MAKYPNPREAKATPIPGMMWGTMVIIGNDGAHYHADPRIIAEIGDLPTLEMREAYRILTGRPNLRFAQDSDPN